MTKRMLVGLLTTLFLTGVSHADAQQAKIYRVGVIMQGGPYYEAIDGLREHAWTVRGVKDNALRRALQASKPSA